MRKNHAIDLGTLSVLGQGFRPVAGLLRPIAPALNLTRQEFSIGRAARPFISPPNLIWYGLPGEETTIARLYNAPTDSFEAGAPHVDNNSTRLTSDMRYVWADYILTAMRDGKHWLSSSGVWGAREYAGLMGLVEILDEWISQQTKIVTLAARQIRATPSGAFPTEIRSVDQWENAGVTPDARSPGMSVRWPLEVYALAKAMLYELRWARAVFGGSAAAGNIPVAPVGGGLTGVIRSYIDCTRTTEEGVCTAVIATTASSILADLTDMQHRTLAMLQGAAGLVDQAGNPPTLEDTFPLFQEVVNYYAEISGLMDQYRELQEIIVATVKEVIDEIASTIGGTVNEIRNFVGTASDVGAAIPVIGLFIQVAFELLSIALHNADIDAAMRRERGMPHLYRGVAADGETPIELTRTDVETWALMMYRAMRLQQMRIFSLVDGTSPLTNALRPKAPGTFTYPTISMPRGGVVSRPGAGTVKSLSAGAKSALAIGGGASAAGLVWWLWKKFSRRTR